jgi:hypothetical protein
VNSSTLGSGRAAGSRVLLAATALAAAVFTLAAGDAVAGGTGSPGAAVGAPIDWGPCKPPGPRLHAPASASASTGSTRTGAGSTSP